MPLLILALFSCLACAAPSPAPQSSIHLSPDDALRIGKMVFKNECGGKISCLTHWSQGEEFASMGIGHFIWFPQGSQAPFHETFPDLLDYLDQNGAPLPAWLKADHHCPWNSRDAFNNDLQSPRMTELRQMLVDTIALQAQWTANRLVEALPKMLEGLPAAQQDQVRAQFNRVAAEPIGVYALVDYLNMKGEGISPKERYNGNGWGLLQVLQEMSGTQAGQAALDEFSQAADQVLTRRVQNSPPARNEASWLSAWRRRVATYRTGQN
jgi:hypothetical protein